MKLYLPEAGGLLMEWTTTKPTKPGWWWYKFTAEERDFDAHAVMRVIESSEVDGLVAMNDEDYDLVVNLNGEWAGPIDPPREAREKETQ